VGPELEAVLSSNVTQRTAPSTDVGLDDDVVVATFQQSQWVVVNRVSQMRDLSPVETHQSRAHEINGDEARADDNKAGGNGVGRFGTIAFARDHPIDD
jgi:hypothetical protein